MSHRKETEAMADLQPIGDWTHIPWRKLERKVYRLQKRIYQASLRGDEHVVHSLQRLLMKSEAARTLAVRRVTQDNQGKRTAGVDGVKSVAPSERLVMVKRLRHHKTIKPKPTRRVWIPKPGKSEKRPLGIPMFRSYCLPYWELSGFPYNQRESNQLTYVGFSTVSTVAYFLRVDESLVVSNGAASACGAL
jgi:N-terminal domain of reverse transcriptase